MNTAKIKLDRSRGTFGIVYPLRASGFTPSFWCCSSFFVQFSMLCFCFLCLLPVSCAQMLSVFLDRPFLVVLSAFCNVYSFYYIYRLVIDCMIWRLVLTITTLFCCLYISWREPCDCLFVCVCNIVLWCHAQWWLYL